MNFSETVAGGTSILCEGSIIETLKHNSPELLNPIIHNSSLLFFNQGHRILDLLYRIYLEIGQFIDLPMLVMTPTWKANPENLKKAGSLNCHEVSRLSMNLLDGIRKEFGSYSERIFIGGQLGPKGDAYKAAEALDADAAEEFHNEQIEALCSSGVDFLLASTLPAFSEALGIGRACSKQQRPYILSFVIREDGLLLDGMPLEEAIEELDSTLENKPIHYWLNCVHPHVLTKAWEKRNLAESVCATRLSGLQANSSNLSPEELEVCRSLQCTPAKILAKAMIEARDLCKLQILGGCCGTNGRHVAAIGRLLKSTEAEFSLIRKIKPQPA
jgi:homocysteine S-methyltransferase